MSHDCLRKEAWCLLRFDPFFDASHLLCRCWCGAGGVLFLFNSTLEKQIGQTLTTKTAVSCMFARSTSGGWPIRDKGSSNRVGHAVAPSACQWFFFGSHVTSSPIHSCSIEHLHLRISSAGLPFGRIGLFSISHKTPTIFFPRQSRTHGDSSVHGVRVSFGCSRHGWRASINRNRDSLMGSPTDLHAWNDAAGLGPSSRVSVLATGCEERLCAWPITGDR